MNQPKLNRCPFCGSSDIEVNEFLIPPGDIYPTNCSNCGADGPNKKFGSIDESAKVWNESYISKAAETLAVRLFDGFVVSYEPDENPPQYKLHHRRSPFGTVYASGETMFEMMMNLQDQVK